MNWYVYLLRCRDDTLYTGMTNDPRRRLAAHNAGTGAKYTRARRPCTMIYCEALDSRGAALSREAALKKLPRARKLGLLSTAENRISEFFPEASRNLVEKE